MSVLHDVPPPHALEAEMAVLGSAMVDREILWMLQNTVKPTHFYAWTHEKIWRVMVDLVTAGIPADRITVAERLRADGDLDRVGGLPYLSSLMDTVQSVGSAQYYATLVTEKAQLRALIAAGGAIIKQGYEGEDDVAGAIGRADSFMRSIVTDAAPVSMLTSDEALQRYKSQLTSKEAGMIFLTCWPHLNKTLGGFRADELIIVAGDSKLGKTFWVNMLAAWFAEKYGRVAMFPLDMGTNLAFARLVALYSSVSSLRQAEHALFEQGVVLDGVVPLTQGQKERLIRGEHLAGTSPISWEDSASVDEIVSKCRRLHREDPLKLVVVDTITALRDLHKPKARDNSRTQNLEAAAWALKDLARELHCPVIGMHHLNRGERDKGRPESKHLRDGGNLDGIASSVLFLHKDVKPDPRDTRHYVIIDRSRDGRAGTIDMHFSGARATWLEGSDPVGDRYYQHRAWCSPRPPEQSGMDFAGVSAGESDYEQPINY